MTQSNSDLHFSHKPPILCSLLIPTQSVIRLYNCYLVLCFFSLTQEKQTLAFLLIQIKYYTKLLTATKYQDYAMVMLHSPRRVMVEISVLTVCLPICYFPLTLVSLH